MHNSLIVFFLRSNSFKRDLLQGLAETEGCCPLIFTGLTANDAYMKKKTRQIARKHQN